MTSGEEQAEAEMLALSIERGDTTTVESAIASDSFDVEARLPRSHRPTPLVLAAECGRAAIVKLLLSAGAQIDSTDDRRMTACHHAALRGFVFVLAALLEHRPNLALMDNEQRTSLQCSFARSNCERSSTMLIVAGAPLDSVPDHRLCSFAASSVTAVHALIGRGVAVRNLHDGHMSTPLHMAAAMGGRDPAVLKRLVDVFGADLSARDCWGATCTFMAAQCANADALRVFIAAGADFNTRDSDNRTPLHVAHRYECSLLLLAAGADVNARDQSRRTAAHIAVENGFEIDAKLILNALLVEGADLDAADRLGITVRHFFANRETVLSAADERVARRAIAKARLELVCNRALQVCIGLQSKQLDALQMCEVLLHACGPVAPMVEFHHWWKLATTVKHFATSRVHKM